MGIKRNPNESYEHRNFVKTKINNDTYEYRDGFGRKPSVDTRLVEIGSCTESVLKTLKKGEGKFYHTTDTNKFYFDYDGKRYELNVFGGSGEGGADLSEYARKSDIPTRTSQLTNDSGYVTLMSLEEFLTNNRYVTEDMLMGSIANLVTADEFTALFSEVASMKDEIREMRETIDSLYSGSDSDDIIDELTRRVSALEESLEENNDWDAFERE